MYKNEEDNRANAKRPGGKTMSELREFDARLSMLEGHVSGLEKRMGAVEVTLRDHGGLLLDIKTAITTMNAQAGPGVGETVRTVSSLATTGAILAGLLIYVASSVMSGPSTALRVNQEFFQKELTRIEHSIDELDTIKANIASLNERAAVATKHMDGESSGRWSTTITDRKN